MNDNQKSIVFKAAAVNESRRVLEEFKTFGERKCSSCMALFDAPGERRDQMCKEDERSFSGQCDRLIEISDGKTVL